MAAVVSLEPRHLEDWSTWSPARPAPRLVLVESPCRLPRPRPARRHQRAVYRRRRVLAAVVGLGLVLAVARAGAALGGSSLATSERLPHVQQVVVQPGDTMWSIARRVAPGRDPRAVVAALVAARGTATLVAGEALAVPAP